MTLAIAWIRQLTDTRELVLASDSRLRFGRAWDCCPKIMGLPRRDSAICFAGDTMYAYPIMLQVSNAIVMHERTLSRASDLTDLNGHLLRVLNQMHSQIHDLPKGEDLDSPEVLFMLAGYSWKVNDFRIWQYYFRPKERKFLARSASTHTRRTAGTKYFHCVGDHVGEARARLYRLLQSRKKLTVGGLGMEPFEVLVEMIRNGKYPTIGGPPQIIKVYRYADYIPYGVYWPSKASGAVTLYGRPLLDYERHRFPALDPDTLEVLRPKRVAV
jgi:hypothetical protein